MQISHRHKFIFFSFPKTGSESMRELLDPYSDIRGIPYWNISEENPFYSHISPAEVKAIFQKNGWDYDEYFKFTFVRNPWARLVSLYNMIYFTKPADSFYSRLKTALLKPKPPSFRDWLRNIRPDGPGAGGPPDQRWQVYGAYSIANYILDKSGNQLVDEVIKLEEIQHQLIGTLNKIGIPGADEIEIPYINKRCVKKYSEYYDEQSIGLVAERYRYDIERFNYKFTDFI